MSVGKVLNMKTSRQLAWWQRLLTTSRCSAYEADGYPRQSHQLRLRRFRCFALGDHLGFAAANMNAMIFP